jgi:hypothetical protein
MEPTAGSTSHNLALDGRFTDVKRERGPFLAGGASAKLIVWPRGGVARQTSREGSSGRRRAGLPSGGVMSRRVVLFHMQIWCQVFQAGRVGRVPGPSDNSADFSVTECQIVGNPRAPSPVMEPLRQFFDDARSRAGRQCRRNFDDPKLGHKRTISRRSLQKRQNFPRGQESKRPRRGGSARNRPIAGTHPIFAHTSQHRRVNGS